MKTTAFAFAVLGLVIVRGLASMAAAPVPEDRTPREKEAARLRGVWRLEKMDAEGAEGGTADAFRHSVMTLGPGDTFVVHNRDGEVMTQGTYDLVPGDRPTAIRFTWREAGRPTPGKETAPYTLDGDTLTTTGTITVTTGGKGPPTTTRYKTTSVYKRIR